MLTGRTDNPDGWQSDGSYCTMKGIAALGVSRTSAARQLAVHSAVVGASWFVVAFAALVGTQLNDGLRDRIGDLPTVVQGIGATVVLVAAVPLAWPIYIAVGWYEAGLASRIRSGDDSARRPAARVLNGQALVFAVASVVGLVVAWLYRNAGSDFVTLAWLPLAVIAALHLRIARALTR